MRVAIDLRPLQIGHEYRGIGTFVVNILSRLPLEGHHYIFYQYDTSDPLADHNIVRPTSYEIVKIQKPIWRRSIISLLKYVSAGLYPKFPKLAKSSPDVFLQSDFQLGLPNIRGCKNYVVMYDLIPLILRDIYMPSWKKPLRDNTLRLYSRFIVAAKRKFHEQRYFNNLYRLDRAEKIISISNSTTDSLQKYLDVKAGRISTIPLAPSFREDGQETVSEEFKKLVDGIHKPFITFIGGTDPRRKIDELVYAFNLVNARWAQVDLVLAGNEFRELTQVPNVEARNAILYSSYKSQVHLLGYLSEAEKGYLLSKTHLFVYPTLYEGFGLPILEAMHAGAPVVAFNNSSIPEVGGSAVKYAGTNDALGIARAIIDILDNPLAAKSMRSAGHKQVSKFSWEKVDIATWDLILNEH
jgi:glycosyltransferase involved in cell wall biosynthesis